MGQAISRTIASRLNQATQRQEAKMMRELLEEAAQKKNSRDKYTDPNAAVWGFQRDTASLQKELEQQAFLQKNASPTTTEMPADLIEFLKAAGPIRKLEQKKITDHATVRTTDSRRQRLMPLRQDLADDEPQEWEKYDKGDGMTVSRSTNFSTRRQDSSDDGQLRLTDSDIYQILADFTKHQHQQTITEFIISQLNHYLPSTDKSHSLIINRNHELLKNALNFTALPRLSYVDDSWVGTHPSHQDHPESTLNHATVHEAQLRLEWEITHGQK